MSAHIGDDAELYALGVLEDDERAAVDSHLAVCGECSQRVGRAERIAVALAAVDVAESPDPARVAPPRAWPAPLRAAWFAPAAACVFAVALGGTLAVERAYVGSILASDSTVVQTLAAAHFLHKPFVPSVAGAPVAKVLYARDGAWLYVVVDAARSGWRLTGDASGARLELGQLQTRGESSVLFVRPPRPVDALRLIDTGGGVVEHVGMLSAKR